VELVCDAADQFAILRPADLLCLKPTGLCSGKFGIAESVFQDFRQLVTKSRFDFGSIFGCGDRCRHKGAVVFFGRNGK